MAYTNRTQIEAEYEITAVDPDGNEYTLIGVNIREGGGPSFGTVEGLAFVGDRFPPTGVELTITAASEGPRGSDTPYTGYATPPCFLAGTDILTPSGPRAVEELAAGDLLITADRGARPLLWAGHSVYSARALRQNPSLAPVVIPMGAFGPNVQRRDLYLSP